MALAIDGICPLLMVYDMPRTIAFYRDVLGFQVVTTAPPGDDCDWALLQLGDAQLMLNTMYEKPNRPPIADAARSAAHRDTALFFACPDLDAAYAHLRAAGLAVKPPVVRDYGMKQLGFNDPEGYGICLQHPVG